MALLIVNFSKFGASVSDFEVEKYLFDAYQKAVTEDSEVELIVANQIVLDAACAYCRHHFDVEKIELRYEGELIPILQHSGGTRIDNTDIARSMPSVYIEWLDIILFNSTKHEMYSGK